MAIIPTVDVTLEAMEKAMELEAAKELPRPYLGMSSIGDSCSRKLWYRFRWADTEVFKASTLSRFADGHYSEDLTADRLNAIEGVTVETRDKLGNQIGFDDIGGHFRGHMDGIIHGLLQSPKTQHVWEHKCVNETKFKKLEKLKAELGEKNALKAWDEVYWAQAILYMEYAGLTRHYLTVCTPGSRDWTSCRTNSDKKSAMELIAKAEMIIGSEDAPPRIGDATYYLCKFCTFFEVCHESKPAKKNCRTCRFSEPAEDGDWVCNKFDDVIPLEFQREGCEQWTSAL